MTSGHDPVAAKKLHRAAKNPHGVRGGSSEANRFAVVILEVLAGERAPADAAQVLGVTSPRYYQLEARALEGLVTALEPRPRVRQPSLEGRIAQLEKALGKAQRECLRQQALVRAAQRNLGIRPPVVAESKTTGKNGTRRKKRRPTVRALKAARTLAQDARLPQVETIQPEDQTVRPAVSALESEGAPHGGIPTVSKGASG